MKYRFNHLFRGFLGIAIVSQSIAVTPSRADVLSLREITARQIARQHQALSQDQFLSIVNALEMSQELKDFIVFQRDEIEIANINNLSSLPKENIQYLLRDKAILTESILAQINTNDLNTMRTLISEKQQSQDLYLNRAYLAAFLAKHTVEFSAAWDAALNHAWNAAWDNAWDAAGNPIWNVAGRTAKNAAEIAAKNAAWHPARSAAWNAAKNIGWEAVSKDTWNTVRNSLSLALPKLKLSNPTQIGQTSYALSELITLNWLRQNNTHYFKDAFNAAYNALDGSLTLEQAKGIIAQHLDKEELSSNPFIQHLKLYLANVEQMLVEQNLQ